jgi:tetratricopeptide (TPR) repeat protein
MWGWVVWGAVVLGPGQGAEELWRAGRRAEAIEVWWRELEGRPGDRAALLRVVEAELEVHRYAAVIEHSVGLGPEGARARGTALFRLGRFEAALGELGRTRADEVAMRVDALEALQRFEEADREIAELERLAGGRSASVESMAARSAVRRGDREGAERRFRKALELDPVEPGALYGLGMLLRSGPRREEGVALLKRHREVTPLLDQLDFARRGVDLAPTHAANHAAVGDAERALGRVDAALEAYERASVLAQGDALVPVALRHARLLSEDRKNLQQALEVLENAFQRCGNPKLLVRCGDLLAESGRTDEARAKFQRALELRPQDAELRARLDALGGR